MHQFSPWSIRVSARLVAIHCLLLLPYLRAYAPVSVCSTDMAQVARIEFPLWVVGSNTFARLHEEPGHHMSWWSWSSDLAWLSLRKTESFLAQTVFFFQFKLQWNDDQHLIANLSIPATMLGSKVGTILLCDIPHPIILKHWVEITPWGAHEKPPDCLNFAVANSFKKGDRCKIHDKEFAAETQLLMCRPRGPELVDLYTMAIYIFLDLLQM